MARTPKTDTPPTPGRRGRKPKAAASSAIAPAVEDDDTASAGADAAVATSAESSTPARGRRGRKPGPRADATKPGLPPAAGMMDPGAAEASPSADGPEPAGDGDAMIAEMAFPVSSEQGGDTGPAKHEQAAAPSDNAEPSSLSSDTSAPATPAARWDRVSDTVSFDWPAIERTAAQHGANQVMARLLLAARAEGAHSRWPL